MCGGVTASTVTGRTAAGPGAATAHPSWTYQGVAWSAIHQVCIELEPFVLWPDNWLVGAAKRKGKDRVRQLVVAGALIAAEINRLQRTEEQETKP